MTNFLENLLGKLKSKMREGQDTGKFAGIAGQKSMPGREREIVVRTPDVDVAFGGGKEGEDHIRLAWPVEHRYEITSPYGERVHPVLKTRKFHKGVDIATPNGIPIYLPEDGEIWTAGMDEDGPLGNRIVSYHVRPRFGFCLLIAHMSGVSVEPGKKYPRGTLIGYSGATGRVTGPHTHIGTYLWPGYIHKPPIFSGYTIQTPEEET